ncbi:MAG TPA: glycosyltransferase family 1 protein [Candidatus Saccharimonadales bacterium]|nr:glycosyltransferase family 1 protein [Candidatus Saccharimonadales bacterium]
MPKRIVIDARESGTSTGRYVDKLIEYLHHLHPNYNIILLAKAERLKPLTVIAPSFLILETPFKEFTFGEQIGFLRQLNDLNADLVHFPMVQQPVWYSGPVVTTMQDLTGIRFRNPSKNLIVFWLKQQVYKWVNKRVARKSAALITPTQFVKDDVVGYTHVRPTKITVTLESADPIVDKPVAVPALQGKSFIMYTGRPTPHKNLERLISAFQLLQSTHPDLRLVLVGKQDANYQRHAERVAAKGVKNVIFTGFVSDGQLKWLYQHCSAYVFPSLSEGFGLPGLEAMAHGAAVASSNATCLPEVHGDAAHYFDPLDVNDMATKIGQVIDDRDLRAQLIKAGKARVGQFSWQRMAEQTLAVYKRVLGA